LDAFGRGLAKIAYCHAVATYGLDAFDPLDVPALILGDYPAVSHYVGGNTEEEPGPPDARGTMHRITISDTSIRDLRLAVVAIRLFSDSGTEHHGMPTYWVVVGDMRAGGFSSPRQPIRRRTSSMG
jgi:hypothetical protein